MASIMPRGKKSIYWIYWYEGKKKLGRETNPPTSDYKEAQRQKTLKEAELIHKGATPHKDIPFNTYAESYLSYSKNNHRPNTYKRNRLTIEYVQAYQPEKLSDITVNFLEKYKADRIAKGNQPRSTNRELITIRAMLNRAVELDYLERNPAKLVKYLKVKDEGVKFLSKEEITRLFEVSRGVWKDAVIIALYTGFRLSEVLYLTWKDIDFNAKTIRVYPKHGFIPKDNDTRTVPLHEVLLSYLQDLKKTAKDEWVLYFVEGRPSSTFFCREIKRTFRRAKLRGFTFHDLRHTYASHLVASGVDLYVVSKLLGHSSFKTTQIYAHLRPDYLMESIKKLRY